MRKNHIIIAIVVVVGITAILSIKNEYSLIDATNENDKRVIETMDTLREDLVTEQEPVQEDIKILEEELESMTEDYSLRIDSFKKLLSTNYKNSCDVTDTECQRNITLSKYSQTKSIVTKAYARGVPLHNTKDYGKLDRWFKSKHSPLNGYGYSFVKYGGLYGVDADFGVCITWADSQSGKMLTTANNWGNVGNNDRGDRIGYETPQEGIEAVFRVVNNQYQKDSNVIGHFSNGGRKIVGSHKSKVYATSEFNWNNNVKGCMTELKGEPVDEWYNVRLNK